MKKVICYVDGFNLYHAIDDLGRDNLKWLNLWSLADSIARNGERIVAVKYFSAFATWMPPAYRRHREYVAALRATGVRCHMARFKDKEVRCRAECRQRYRTHEEKETDVHFALSFLEDAFDDNFDRAIIISADSDYVPAVKKVGSRYPRKEVFLAAPPKRLGRARDLRQCCSGKLELSPGRLAKHQFSRVVTDANGNVAATRPSKYDP